MGRTGLRRLSLRLLALSGGMVTGALLCAAPAGAAGFSSPDQISGACPAASALQVVMNGPGDEFAAWACNDQTGANPFSVQEAALPAGGAWSAAVTVGGTNSPGGMAIAIDGG